MRTIIRRLVNIIGAVVNDPRLKVIVRSEDRGLDGATVLGPGSREYRRLEFDRHHKLGISAWLAADQRHQPSAVLQALNKRIGPPAESDTGKCVHQEAPDELAAGE